MLAAIALPAQNHWICSCLLVLNSSQTKMKVNRITIPSSMEKKTNKTMQQKWKNQQTVLRTCYSCLCLPGHAPVRAWPGTVTRLSQHIHWATILFPHFLVQRLEQISWDDSKLPKCPNSLDEATYMCPFWHKFLSRDASKLFFGSISGNRWYHLASKASISPRNLEVSLTRIPPGEETK